MKLICKNIIYVLIITCTLSVNLFGQNNTEIKDSINYEKLAEKLKGTYQIEMIDTRSLPSFPAELLIIIEEKRQDNQVVYHQVSEIMRIKIFSKSTLNTENFKPADHIVYISIKDL